MDDFLQFLPIAAVWLIPPIVCLDKGKTGMGIFGLLAPFGASIIGFAAGAAIFAAADVGDEGWDALGALLGAVIIGMAVWVAIVLGGIVTAIVGAVRLAKPGSGWARRRYGPEKLTEARLRHGGPAPAIESPS